MSASRYHVQTRREIHAPIERVWEILTGVEHYGDWNPFVVKVEMNTPQLQVGTKMTLHVRWPGGGGVKAVEQVKVLDAPAMKNQIREATWIYNYLGMPAALGMVRGSRIQKLRQEPGKPVIYTGEEIFTGWARPFLPLQRVIDGFEAQATALKGICELR
ncbi:MAG: SRPBCC domain-containing protein [Bacteroidia bacterium]|nr:SRPBCC domain-containing protein [Bacteroidia bacterium]